MRYSQNFKVPPQKTVINFIEERSNFIVKKAGRHHFHQVTKVWTVVEQNGNTCHLTGGNRLKETDETLKLL